MKPLPPLAEFDSETQRAAFMRRQGWTVLPLRDCVFDDAGNQVAVRVCGFRYVEPRPRTHLLFAATVCLVLAFAMLWAFVEFNR